MNQADPQLVETQQLRLEVAWITGQIEVLQARLADLDAADEHRRAELDAARADAADAHAELRDAQARMAEQRRQVTELRDRLAEAERQRATAEPERAARHRRSRPPGPQAPHRPGRHDRLTGAGQPRWRRRPSWCTASPKARTPLGMCQAAASACCRPA